MMPNYGYDVRDGALTVLLVTFVQDTDLLAEEDDGDVEFGSSSSQLGFNANSPLHSISSQILDQQQRSRPGEHRSTVIQSLLLPDHPVSASVERVAAEYFGLNRRSFEHGSLTTLTTPEPKTNNGLGQRRYQSLPPSSSFDGQDLTQQIILGEESTLEKSQIYSKEAVWPLADRSEARLFRHFVRKLAIWVGKFSKTCSLKSSYLTKV